jgi:hypothetical protein
VKILGKKEGNTEKKLNDYCAYLSNYSFFGVRTIQNSSQFEIVALGFFPHLEEAPVFSFVNIFF